MSDHHGVSKIEFVWFELLIDDQTYPSIFLFLWFSSSLKVEVLSQPHKFEKYPPVSRKRARVLARTL